MTAQEEFQDESISVDELNDLIGRANSADVNSSKTYKAISSLDSAKKDGNFLHFQLSTQEMLEKLEHLYRGDFLVQEDGDTFWKKQTNKDLVTFNEYGVTSLMEIVTKYIDRNTILSYYTEERIYEIMGDLGDELILFILCNYEKLGMDTYFKKTKFRIMIVTTLHIIESTYKRALRGKTIDEINQSRVIGQFGEIPRRQEAVPIKKTPWYGRILG